MFHLLIESMVWNTIIISQLRIEIKQNLTRFKYTLNKGQWDKSVLYQILSP